MCLNYKTTLYCCLCFRLKTGIIVIGCWDSILFLAIMALLIYAAATGRNVKPKLDYCIIMPFYVFPFVSILPAVIAFYYLVCRGFRLSARQLYRYARLLCMLTSILCLLLQIANMVYAGYFLKVNVEAGGYLLAYQFLIFLANAHSTKVARQFVNEITNLPAALEE